MTKVLNQGRGVRPDQDKEERRKRKRRKEESGMGKRGKKGRGGRSGKKSPRRVKEETWWSPPTHYREERGKKTLRGYHKCEGSTEVRLPPPPKEGLYSGWGGKMT